MSSSEFSKCVVCETERLTETLDAHGRCPFCEDEPLPEKDQPKKTYKKRTTKVKVEKTATAPPVEEKKPQPKADEISQEVLEQFYEAPNYAAPKSAQQELAMRELCRRKLLPFIQRFRPKYTAGWVHEDICRRLERFMRQVEEGLSPRLLLMMPPRSGKSEIGSRHFPPWVLGHHPDWEIIAASHTSGLTMSFSRYIRDVLRDPACAAVFPDTLLDPSSQSIENWNLTKGGGYLAAGVGTGITGRGAHILLLDDLVKDMEAADSTTIKDNTWEWYGSTAYTRLAPGGGVLGIMTWWSEDDWAGRIQTTMQSGEGDQFEIVRYPAINDDGDEYILPDDSITQFSSYDKVPEGAKLTRKKDTALHPARYDTEAMLRIKRNLIATGQKRVWQSLYQQNPMPEDGLFFTKDMFRYTPALPDPHWCRVYQAWDFAITEDKSSDYTVGTTIYQDEHDNLYVADVRRFRSSDSLYIVDVILDYAREYNATLLGFEDGQIWKTMQAQFEKRCAERKYYPSYEILKPLTDKQVRAHPLRGRMQAGKIWFLDKAFWLQDLFNEMTRFPAGKHDDQIDSLAWNVRLTLGQAPPKPRVKEKKVKSWKDDLNKYIGGSKTGRSHMSS